VTLINVMLLLQHARTPVRSCFCTAFAAAVLAVLAVLLLGLGGVVETQVVQKCIQINVAEYVHELLESPAVAGRLMCCCCRSTFWQPRAEVHNCARCFPATRLCCSC
jgi:hypothetical protein